MFFLGNLLRFKGLLFFTFFALLLAAEPVFLQAKKDKKPVIKNQKELNIFPDEYSELDEIPIPKTTKDENILKILEKSRQKYLQALIYIEKKDTLTAAKHFEEAIKILNRLVSYPGIEQNEDFTDLAQSIIEDYESYIQSIDNLSENSSFFIIRDKYFQGVDSQKSATTQVKPLTIIKDTILKKLSADEKKTDDKFTIPLVENEFVQKNITFLTQGKPRKFFQKWLERTSRWFPMMRKIIKEEGMPDEIIYLSMIESGLNPTAVSRAKAVGLWQFIRETGSMYGLNDTPSVWIDERRNPEKATRAAMKHLKDLYNDLGDWHLALAAYNCGINGVKRSIMKAKVDTPSFWNIRQFLPKETRNYVPLYIAAAKITLNHEEYGFKMSDLQFHSEYVYEVYPVKECVALTALAKCAGVTVEEIQILNPELISSCTPPDVGEYPVRLPTGSTQTFVAKLATLTPEEKQPWIMCKVEKGESIQTIAERYGVSEKQIISANNLPTYRTRIKKGTIIRIPIEQNDSGQEKRIEEDDDNNTQTSVQPVSTSTDKDTPVGKKDYITHVVSKGETLYSIAQRYGVRISDLRNMNDIPYEKEDIDPGQRLKIAVSSSPEGNTTPVIKKLNTPVVFRHKVRQGETLAQIADDYGVTIDNLKKLNKIEGNLQPGQVLKVQALTAPKDKPVKKKEIEMADKHPIPAIQQKTTHKVRKGENLGTIAARYGVTESQLRKWNPNAFSGKKLLAGAKLKVYQEQPAKGGSVTNNKKVNKLPKYYTVKKGDNLSEIADKFGISVKALKKKNKNLSDRTLKRGQKIRLQ